MIMVVTMKTSNRWLGLLGAAATMFSASVLAYSDSVTFSDSNSTTALGCNPWFCDPDNNSAECGYDSGDCCECTCVDTPDFSCGIDSRFLCIDPNALCVDDDDITIDNFENCGSVASVGDGFCDTDNNNNLCGFDGGDCCECTCLPVENELVDDDFACSGFFQCVDPDAPCVDDDDITIDQVENCGFIEGFGNSFCDPENNNELCGFDGGDCCQCTCTQSVNDYDDEYSSYGCDGNFLCIDPGAPCVDDDDITVDNVENCDFAAGIGNGFCNEDNNNEDCNFDGGDCCQCTCEGQCDGGFACIDPSAPCVDDDDITVDIDETCDTVAVGDAVCDDENNRPECNYDGGDCCACTCEDGPTLACGEFGRFACIDPGAPCVNDDDITADFAENCDVVGIGNGFCDIENNIAACNYDGGDCCQCTCQSDGPPEDDEAPCGRFAGFACIDPTAPCVDDDSVTIDQIGICEVSDIGDGICDLSNNIQECNYDGGDCCECTCEIREFGVFGCNQFACIDPEAPCVDDDSITTDFLEACEDVIGVGDGNCDDGNNNELCAYDGGDCCSCTCESDSDDDFLCSADGSGFDCRDPAAECFDAGSMSFDFDMSMSFDFDTSMSFGFDMGMPFSSDMGMPFSSVFAGLMADYGATPFWEQKDGLTPTVYELYDSIFTADGAVEVGTKTLVGVSATAHDVRRGGIDFDIGCGEIGGDGCAAGNTRDGSVAEAESRWSCSPSLTEPEGPCQIVYSFLEPQDIVGIQIAFWKSNERTRTVAVYLDGVRTQTHESCAEPTFNTIDVEASGVSTVMIESVDLPPSEWLSLLEVLIFVAP